MDDAGELTRDAVLDGKVRLTQSRDGYRVAIDPVLLAAAVPARPGQSVLDVGSGTGAAALCLQARVGGLSLTGLERDAGALALARMNAADNGAAIDWVEGDVMAPPSGLIARQFHHVMSNPPYHSTGRGRPSPMPGRASAHAVDEAAFPSWLSFCAGRVRDRGTLTLILPAVELARAMAVLEPLLGGIAVQPLWPRAGRPAKRVILQARRSRGAPSRLMPGLVLHDSDGGYTDQALGVLRGAAAIEMDG